MQCPCLVQSLLNRGICLWKQAWKRSDVMELKIEHLSKQFKDKKAVDDACITLTPGVWGLLGANGA